MDSISNGESLPLLGALQPQRLHYLDNLRATLTVLLIFHHAAIETANNILPVVYTGWQDLLVSLFSVVGKSSLWGLFFFVSGYSTSLSLASNSSDYHFFLSRTLKIGIPAWLYAVIGHPALFMFLSFGWGNIFGSYKSSSAYRRLSGPVAYVFMLLALDCLHLFVRWCGRNSPEVLPSRLITSLQPSSRRSFFDLVALSMGILSIFTFMHSVDFRIAPSFIYLIQSYDSLGPDAPLSYVIAYVAGVNFRKIKEYLDMDLPSAYTSLITSLLFSFTTMGIAQYLSPELWQLIRIRNPQGFFSGGYNLHTIFFALWSTFAFYSIPVSVISIFTRAPWATREWGFLARHTYVQMYVNMIPILLAIHFLTVRDAILKTILVGLFGVGASWIIMVGWMVLWGYTKRIGNRYLSRQS